MSVGTLSPQQLKSLVEEKWKRDAKASAFGLHAAEGWHGPEAVELEIGKAAVVRADTVFQFREALRNAERNQSLVILLTRLQQNDLGNDVVARLAKSRLFGIDHWASLCAVFKAVELDRSVCDPAIVQALVEHAPPDGYPPVSAGVLDAGTVRKAICRHVLGMDEAEPDLAALLRWAASKASRRYLDTSEALKASLRPRVCGPLGEVAESIFRFLDSGAAGDSLALAICCQVVFGDSPSEKLVDAAARMERYHSNLPIADEVGRKLAAVAAEAIADLDRMEESQVAGDHLRQADELLKILHCDQYAHRSGLTSRGYEQRMAKLAAGIKAAVAGVTIEAIGQCEAAQALVRDHRLARLGRRTEQIRRTEMALRLLRWLRSPAASPVSFAERVDHYRREIAFVDWARDATCRAEDVVELAEAFEALSTAVYSRREAFNVAFAESLKHWTEVGSTEGKVIGVEDVLSQIVAKVVAAGNRVLLVVLDGISWAVAHELLDDVRQEHWYQATLDPESALPQPVVAAIPSVTNRSRTSLLSGTLAWGDAAAEKRNFDAVPTLRPLCEKKHPPVVFHKKDLTSDSPSKLGKDVVTETLNADRRVVGVVINAVDDRLSNAQQLRNAWSLDSITPLAALLSLARDAGRVVILASDHGHVWHHSQAELRPGDGGSRWRTASGPPTDGEIRLTGKRVRDPAGESAVIVPATEAIYYGKQLHGYHGGATPQEMVCPLVLLTDQNLSQASKSYPGLHACEYLKPEWWSPAPVSRVREELPSRPSVVRHPPPDRLFDDTFEDETPPADTDVVAEPTEMSLGQKLLQCLAYKEQKKLVRRHPPDDDVVRRCLAALAQQGGLMTPAALCRAADIPAGRLDGQIALIQRVLNLDGYDILTFSRAENKIELNISRLKRQFDLE